MIVEGHNGPGEPIRLPCGTLVVRDRFGNILVVAHDTPAGAVIVSKRGDADFESTLQALSLVDARS